MMAQKWNVETRKYEVYELPDGSVLVPLQINDYCPCVQCSSTISYGKSYTSLEVHNHIGLGYPVCATCYEAEHKRRIEAIEKDL